jgi:hypothetical protein
MKFVLFLMIGASFLAAFVTSVSSGLTWTYYPSRGIGIPFYEFNNWIVLTHLTVGVGLMFFWPKTNNGRMILVAFAIFLGSLLFNFGTQQIRVEKETTVKIDDRAYRVSNYEEPNIDMVEPFGRSPFRPRDPQLGEIEALYFSPKQQFEFEEIFENERAERFLVGIYASNVSERKKVKDPFIIKGQTYSLVFFPEREFTNPDSPEKFKTFIEQNRKLIEQDIAERTAAAPNLP